MIDIIYIAIVCTGLGYIIAQIEICIAELTAIKKADRS